MEQKSYSFEWELYQNADELNAEDAVLLKEARNATSNAYAPYSHFRVGAAALLSNGKIITGSNQENASFPAGICAERVLLSAVSSIYPDEKIKCIAISYHNMQGESNHPVTPCGICRQSLSEYENRMQHSIRLVLGGKEGNIFVIASAGMLLPLSFSGKDLIIPK